MQIFCPGACKKHANFVGTVLANARSMPRYMLKFCPEFGQKNNKPTHTGLGKKLTL
jgi:hypothetical protein